MLHLDGEGISRARHDGPASWASRLSPSQCSSQCLIAVSRTTRQGRNPARGRSSPTTARDQLGLLVPMVAGLVIIWAADLLHDAAYVPPAHAVRHA